LFNPLLVDEIYSNYKGVLQSKSEPSKTEANGLSVQKTMFDKAYCQLKYFHDNFH